MVERNENREIDRKWKEIFSDYDVLNRIDAKGYFEITASQIRQYKEARLMTKFDYINSLPDIFFDHNLSILPITRGKYVIGPFKAYESIKKSNAIFRTERTEISFPQWVQSLDYTNITSESTMLNASYISGMINEMFDAEYAFQTISGRSGSGEFDFNIENTQKDGRFKIHVKNSQLEIDAGFETENSLILLEAKNNVTSSFLIRQLYYPYRLWSEKVNKPVIPVYLQYSNGTYNFSVFKFNDLNNYNSLELVERRNFLISEESISTQEIIDAIVDARIVPEPDYKFIPFPQADDLNKVLDIINSIYGSEKGYISYEDITLKHDFTMRQAQYYSDAALYLDWVTITHGKVRLTNKGESMMHRGEKGRKLEIIRSIFSHKPFKTVVEYRLNHGMPLSRSQTYEIISENGFFTEIYADSTILRRSSTINSWIATVLDMTTDY